MLPQRVLKQKESALWAFFWSGTALKKTGAKVQWNNICIPKGGGGLGFRVLKEWNKASTVRHLWAICQKDDALWVKWILTSVIKGKCIWAIRTPSNASWTVGNYFS